MKEFDLKAKRDNKLMSVLKVNEISHIVASTDKGNLVVRLRKGEKGKDYRFVLDAVPFDDKVNKEIMALIGKQVVEQI